jgi:hypothetical protein
MVIRSVWVNSRAACWAWQRSDVYAFICQERELAEYNERVVVYSVAYLISLLPLSILAHSLAQ